MASIKRIGFFWGEEKITIVEFDRNNPVLVVSSPLGTKSGAASPFSSSLTEEIQITATLQKVLQDNHIGQANFNVALPLKDIILRSFIIPFVKSDDVQNAIKYEAKKYIPFDIQDLVFVYHAIPFDEDKTKRLQVIFFAVRKEVIARYDRIFKQVNAEVTYCEPYMISLSKALMSRKEIKPTDHLAFLILEKNIGRICFIDKGIPQFIREFPMNLSETAEEDLVLTQEKSDPSESLNMKIVNEVGNSFDFYARQFSGERIDQMIVSSDFIQKDLLNTLETELKVKIRRFSLVVTTGVSAQSNDMESIYAMGAGVPAPIEELSNFNFLKERSPRSQLSSGDLTSMLDHYKDVVFIFVICAGLLLVLFLYFQVQLKFVQKQYQSISVQEGDFVSTPLDTLQADITDNANKLSAYKNIRTKSEVTFILLRIASHLPVGTLLTQVVINYGQGDANNEGVTVDIKGDVLKEDLNEQIKYVNEIFSNIKNDNELSKYFKNVNLTSLNIEEINGKKASGFVIHCA